MRCVVSRVDHASVDVEGQTVGRIAHGLLVYVGIIEGDTERDVPWMAEKLCAIRLFPDDHGKMNRSVRDVEGALLLIPNFTLAGATSKGTRPSFTRAAEPDAATVLFDQLTESCAESVPTQRGRFGAHMQIDTRCNGPVTVIVDSPK